MSAMDNAHALVIGIANYQYINKLPREVLNDAQDIRDLLINPQYCGYPEDNVRLLLDEQASQSAIRQQLADLAERSDPESTAFIYISGHGGRILAGPNQGEYLLPVGVEVEYDDDGNMVRDADGQPLLAADTAISSTELTQALEAIRAQKKVIIFDCCHSAGFTKAVDEAVDIEALGIKRGFSDQYYDKLATGRGRAVLASSRNTEYSYVLPGDKNSLFTLHLLAGLRGGAPGSGGVIRIFDIFNYVQPRVTEDQRRQHPIFKAEIEENFPIALYMGGKAPEPLPAGLHTDEYAYDVFISYSSQKADRAWVRETLLPRLEDEGLRVMVDFRAPLGVPKITFRENAIQDSRYTLLVLSESYLESDYAEFENIIAQHIGLEESQYRMQPLMIEDCKPRLGIRILPILDMSDEDEFELNIERLIYQLRLPQELRRH